MGSVLNRMNRRCYFKRLGGDGSFVMNDFSFFLEGLLGFIYVAAMQAELPFELHKHNHKIVESNLQVCGSMKTRNVLRKTRSTSLGEVHQGFFPFFPLIFSEFSNRRK